MLAKLPRLVTKFALRHGLALLIWLGLAVTLVGAAAIYLRSAERAAVARAFAAADAAAETLEQQVLRVFEVVESLLEMTQSRQLLLDRGALFGAEAMAQHLARMAGNGRAAVQQVSIIDRDGLSAWSSVPGWRPTWLGDREHFRVHANDAAQGLFLSKPIQGRISGRWTVQASRRLITEEGEFAGVAVVSLDPVALSRLIGEKGPLPGLSFELRRLPEGAVLAHSGTVAPVLERAEEGLNPLVVAAATRRGGIGRFSERPGGPERLAAFRGPEGIPLIAVAGLDASVALASYHQLRGMVVAGTALVLLVGLLAVALSVRNRGLREQIAAEAVLDPLTGLHNRRHLTEALRVAIAATGRENSIAGLLLLDLDRFKEVNETLGHGLGDSLLCGVAQRLQAAIRESDTLVRLGGDEFAVLQDAPREAADAAALASRLQAALVHGFDLRGQQVQVGASIGIALAPLDGATPETLIRNAEIALYRAKADGRGRHRFFEPAMDAAMQARRNMELGLRDALARNELELHYQPLFDLRQWRVSGFEALLRWRRPGQGLVSPAEFIPLAEETGLITPIGEWVLNRACADATAWPSWVKVAVNLSPVQFRGGGAVPAVQAALAASGLAPQRLELEITEGVLLQDSDETLVSLRELRGLGARIALDDFGSGYSSLNYLLRFPFDKVKIDRSFVGDLCEGPGGEGTVIVRAIIGMCRNLNIATTAEGVESEQQLRRLGLEGCHEAQGYLLSRPRPAAEVPAMLEEPLQRLVPAAA